MNLLTKKLVLDSTNDISILKETKEEKIKIILRGEHIFIKIFKINRSEGIEDKINRLIKDMFSTNKPLVHHEILWSKGKCFLIVYLIGCDVRFKKLLSNKKSFKLVPYEFIVSKYISLNRVKVILSELNNVLRLRIYFKSKLVSLKECKEELYVDEIKNEIKKLEEVFNIKCEKFDLLIDSKHLNEELKEIFKKTTIKELRGDKYLHQKI